MKKEWAPIPGYPGYLVSTHGEVYGERLGRLLRTKGNPYDVAHLSVNGKQKAVGVHHLVALAFVPGYFEGAIANHKDGNKRNNRADNFEWVTHQENIAHAGRTGLMTPRKWIVLPSGRLKQVAGHKRKGF